MASIFLKNPPFRRSKCRELHRWTIEPWDLQFSNYVYFSNNKSKGRRSGSWFPADTLNTQKNLFVRMLTVYNLFVSTCCFLIILKMHHHNDCRNWSICIVIRTQQNKLSLTLEHSICQPNFAKLTSPLGCSYHTKLPSSEVSSIWRQSRIWEEKI